MRLNPVEITVDSRNPLAESGCVGYQSGMKRDPEMIKALVERIVMLLGRRGLTQKAFADRASLAENRISKWLAGQGEPTASDLWRMSRELGVQIDDLFAGEASAASPRNDFELAVALIRKLGTDEAIRRLTLDGRGRDASGDYSHGRHVGPEGEGEDRGRERRTV